MAERGARPDVPEVRLKIMRGLRAFFTPLLPDDYIEMINPLWSTQELRGKVVRVERESGNAATIHIKPGWKWPGHEPGQYLRIGIVVDGIHHWRAYSLTSDPLDPDGLISITPKHYEPGTVSGFLVRQTEPGTIVRLGGVEGMFVLPDPAPAKLLFVTAGSGITPVMAMLRHLARQDQLGDVVHVHSAHTADDVIFGSQLRKLREDHDGYHLIERHTETDGRLKPEELDELVPDWRDREAFACGPAEMLDALTEHWEAGGDPERLHMERFQPIIGGEAGEGAGGTVQFRKSKTEAVCDGGTPILVAGEENGLELPFGCRMGICHTCTGALREGKVRDLRTGEITDGQGQMVRTCVNAPEGPVTIDL